MAYAFATKIIGKLLKPVDALKGGLVIIILAGIIMISSLILNVGKYKNYPSLKWAIGVAASLAGFAVGALALGAAVFGPQALVFLAGLAAILVTSAVIGQEPEGGWSWKSIFNRFFLFFFFLQWRVLHAAIIQP